MKACSPAAPPCILLLYSYTVPIAFSLSLSDTFAPERLPLPPAKEKPWPSLLMFTQ